MCLAIPAKIAEIKEDGLAIVDVLGVRRSIALDLVPAAKVGDYVLVHAGFAIEIVDECYAQETIELIKDFPELAADTPGGNPAAKAPASIPGSDPAAKAPTDAPDSDSAAKEPTGTSSSLAASSAIFA